MNYLLRSIILLVFIQVNLLNAQDFQGTAIYEVKLIDAVVSTLDDSTLDKDKAAALAESMKVFHSRKRTFVLNFNKTESVYQEEEQLELPTAPTKGMVIKMVSSGFGKTYKNLVKKQEIIERDMFLKEFLVTEPLVLIDWKLESETKKIGDYTCYKATGIIPISEAEEEAYNKRVLEQEQRNSLILGIEKLLPQNITVWYTPEIPVNHGPENLWGLPGLILEVNDGRTITLCSKIVLNAKNNLKINAPTKGTVISQKDYDDLEQKKLREMRESRR
ncbi:GLPGLI family protein [Flavobacterium antarcticum]|uniref:GLPGLI family protein n=1 Tax=Flavobacterium antarcticum TaxID=271155 RepID=UPI0003B6F1BD|nr:GLPGLI family protein [Flavobacterium antarcticum]